MTKMCLMIYLGNPMLDHVYYDLLELSALQLLVISNLCGQLVLGFRHNLWLFAKLDPSDDFLPD